MLAVSLLVAPKGNLVLTSVVQRDHHRGGAKDALKGGNAPQENHVVRDQNAEMITTVEQLENQIRETSVNFRVNPQNQVGEPIRPLLTIAA